jgi:chemotaxis protein histidine kinase CheA
MDWTQSPELVATFRAEVDDRLASMRDGLMALEGNRSPRLAVEALMRDAHTVKGSARMLGLLDVVELAHRAEDLLDRMHDGRIGVRTDLVDLLLVTAEALGRSVPGADRPVPPAARAEVLAALDAALVGADPVVVPRLVAPPATAVADVDPDVDDAPWGGTASRAGDHVRVPTRRVHGLLDVVGEAELEVRRIERRVQDVAALLAEHQLLVRGLRTAMLRGAGPTEVSDTVTGMVAVTDRLQVAARDLRSRSEDASGRLARVRDGAMGLAMVPVRRVVAGFPALVREVATATGKDVELVTVGVDVELDVRVLDGVADALRHLVTNAVDHGCEPPERRVAAGKAPRAVVTVSARQAGSTVVIEVADDGWGIDDDALRDAAVRQGLLGAEAASLSGAALHRMLFAPGLSTRTQVTDTSGRGVGLDVVRTAVEGLGGSVDVENEPGAGTRFVLTLPVTLGVVRCLVVRLGQERYAVPLGGVLETVSMADLDVHDIAGSRVVARDDDTVPLADLGDVLGVSGGRAPRAVVMARLTGETLAWAVDEVEGEREIVVKSLGDFLGAIPGTSGATIDDDGSVLLLVDLRELAARWAASPVTPALPPLALDEDGDGPSRDTRRPAGAGRARVLVVEDSIGVRELQRTILETAGYDVVTAVDGLDGAGRLQDTPVDLVLSDVEMPGMDGFTLTRTIRRTRGWENVPVVIMTSRGDDADKRAGLDAGCDAYLLKSEFDQHALVDTVRRLVGR